MLIVALCPDAKASLLKVKHMSIGKPLCSGTVDELLKRADDIDDPTAEAAEEEDLKKERNAVYFHRGHSKSN